MAAGLGSRFGGVKQLAKVGPAEEALLDFSIRDARTAGFETVVLIVRADIEDDVKAHLAQHHSSDGIVYVRQDDLGPPREKPWGTLHAVLSAAGAVDRPFAVINADDYYGPSSYVLAAECLDGITAGEAANVAFELGHTVPQYGSVTRAVTAVADGQLTAIVETEDCMRLDDGRFSAGGEIVPADTPVSMNMWCFHDGVFADFELAWKDFYAENADAPKAEALLPSVVGDLMAAGRLTVKVVASAEQWIGITNPEDFETAKAALADR
ncbi:MAG: NTP transferase domain-containing protein [Actinomycetota bacterium]